MFIETLEIEHFRNLSSVHLEFSKGFNVLYGANAQGKSNLLEAIYTLSFLKGFRADRLSDLIEFEGERARLSAVVCTGSSHTRLGVELEAKCRHAYVDGVPCARARDYLGLLRSILFVPMDVGFLQAAPASRRTMLDRMVFTLKPSYLIDLEQYQKVCKQKSAVLRAENPDESLLDVYDAQLLQLGTRLLEARYEYMVLLSPHVARVFKAIFDSSCHCVPVYKSSSLFDPVVFDSDSGMIGLDVLIKSYRDALEKGRSREIARQQIVLGPHRDDWSLSLDGRQAKFFASQGQQRAMSLAMKIAEIECLRVEADIEPVFLLDDVSSELDPVRHKRLFEYLNALTAQTFLTTTSKEHVHLESIGRIFRVENGSIVHEQQ